MKVEIWVAKNDTGYTAGVQLPDDWNGPESLVIHLESVQAYGASPMQAQSYCTSHLFRQLAGELEQNPSRYEHPFALEIVVADKKPTRFQREVKKEKDEQEIASKGLAKLGKMFANLKLDDDDDDEE